MPLNKSTLSGSISVLGDIELTGSLLGTASWALNSVSASHTLLADGLNATSLTLEDLIITNTASIEYLNVIYQSSSVIYSSGSNIFGDSPSDTQTLHGQVNIIDNVHISGTLQVDGGISGNLTGSLQGNASTATSSSHALVADVASYVENAQSASYFLTSSVTSASRSEYSAFAENSSEALLANTASYVENAQSASYFLTSSVTSASFALSASHVVGAKDVGFSKEWHVSVGSGSDATGNGSLSKPFATLGKAFSVVGGTGEQIVVHPGLYLEPSASLTQPNVTICAANANAGGIAYMNGTITIAPANSSTRISGILFNNLIHSGSAGLYLDKVQVKANYTKIGSGYSEISDTDLQASGSIVFKGGTTVIQGDKQGIIQVSGSGTTVFVKNSYQLVSPSAVAGGVLAIDNSIVYPLASGSAAITSQAGTVVYLYNSNITTATGLPERINIGGFLGYHDTIFNKNLSTLGTSLNVRSNFQSLDANNLTATGSLFGTASWSVNAISANTASWANNFITSSVTNATYALSASYFSGSNVEVSSLRVKGTASIDYLDVRFESASVIYSSGSNIFGDAADDTQTLNGQVNIINDAQIDGELIVLGGITGDLSGNADTSTSASHADSADTLNAQSLTLTNLTVTGVYDPELMSGGAILQGLRVLGDTTTLGITYTDTLNAMHVNAGNTIKAANTIIVNDYFEGGWSPDTGLLQVYGVIGAASGSIQYLSSPFANLTGSFSGSVKGDITGNADTATSASFSTVANGLNPGSSIDVVNITGSGNIQVGGKLNFTNLPNYSNDVDAAAGGIEIGDIYRNGNFVVIRIS